MFLPATPSFRRHLWRTGIIVLGVNLLIALLLTLFVRGPFWENCAYSNLIGLSIWTFIELGRRHFIREGAGNLLRWLAVILIAASSGYLLGSLGADVLTGRAPFSIFMLWLSEPHRAGINLLLALLTGLALTYYFVSRERLAQTRAQAAESRLKLLETQLEPHMLFNTLANLRALIAADPARATAMLDRLIAYLRATLDASRLERHTLDDEFQRLRDYLELMSVRMGSRLRYTLDLPTELAQQPVPPLLLQPLVENSIRHGLEPKVQGGSIAVRARREGMLLTLEVSDTGIGLPTGATATAATERQGFGLAQVRERLLTAYGPQASLRIGTLASGGFTATLAFPCSP